MKICKQLIHEIFAQRNKARADSLELLTAGHPGPIFVAVGAGYLFSPENLLECLKNRGYTVSRPVR